MIGLGKMGFNMALNLRDHGHEVYGYDIDGDVRHAFEKEGFRACADLASLLERNADTSITIFMMIPDQMVDKVLYDMEKYLKKEDIVIDGGNSNFNVSIKRYHSLKRIGVHFVDLGTSGGTKGARKGLCLMAGGDRDVVSRIEPLLKDLSVENGFIYTGKPGTGHFIKMVHNGIEYGMMQAIGEGFALIKASPFELDHQKIAQTWVNGSLIASTLMEYVAQAFTDDQELENVAAKVDETGEGMWMIEEALRYKVALPIITQSLYARYKSKDEDQFSERVVAAMRQAFGGHTIYHKK